MVDITGLAWSAANLGGMDRAEAEAIYDSGRDACVKVLLALANQVERAQPGHPGSGRGLLSIERVDEVICHLPEVCKECGHSLAGAAPRGPIRRHQVAELPEIAVQVTEHQLARRRCPGCGALTQAGLPLEVPRERFGPRLQGALATLAAGFRLSRRQAADLCGELFGVKIALGTVEAIIARQGSALREPQERLFDAVRGSPVLCVDETGWKQAGEKRFLWGAFTRSRRRPSGRALAPPRGGRSAARRHRRDRHLRSLMGLRLS